MANVWAERWLMQNQQRMVNCPHQPGNLVISQNACSKRHIEGRRKKLNGPLREDLFYHNFLRGLSLCRRCSIGRKIAKAQRQN